MIWKNLNYKTCIVSLILLICGNLIPEFNQAYGTESDTNIYRVVSGSFFEQFRDNPDFDYEPTIREGSALLWSNLWEYIKSLFEDLGKIVEALPLILRIIMIGLVIFLIYIIITRTRIYRVFYTQREFSSPSFEIIDEESQIIDFETAINREIQNKQFRKAIRLQYLKIIDKLDKSGIISYSKEKTNYDFINELKDSNQKEIFSAITKSYNVVWYGKIDLDENTYKKLLVDFSNFNLTMHAENK